MPVVFLSSKELELCAFIGAKIVIMVEIEPKHPPPSSKSRKQSASGIGIGGCSSVGNTGTSSSTRRSSRHNSATTRVNRQHNRHHRMLEPSSLPPRWGEGVAPPPTPQYNNTPHVSPESSEMTGAGASIRYHRPRRRIERENPASSSSSTLAFRSSQQSMSCRTVAILVTWLQNYTLYSVVWSENKNGTNCHYFGLK